ncbi:MAG TPA: hypothetical protein VGC45_02890 [Gryllotalpicola sp.]
MIYACLETLQIPAISEQSFWVGRSMPAGRSWFIPVPGEENPLAAIERHFEFQLSVEPFWIRMQALGEDRDFDLVEGDQHGFRQHSGDAVQHFGDHVARLYANYFDLRWAVGIPEHDAVADGTVPGPVRLSSPGPVAHLGATLAMANGSADYELTLSEDRTRIIRAEKLFHGALAHRVTFTDFTTTDDA